MRPDSSSLEGTPNYETPPDEYEPQTELTPDQSPTIIERDSVDVADTEAELELDDNLEDLEADDGDDYAVDDEDGDDN